MDTLLPIEENEFSLLTFFFLTITYLELVLWFTSHGLTFNGLSGYIILFSTPLALILFCISSFFEKKINCIIAIISISVITLLFMIQMIYHTIFNVYLNVFTAIHGVGALQFGSIIANGIRKNLFPLLLLLIPLLILVTIGRKKWFQEEIDRNFKSQILVSTFFIHLLCLLLLPLSGQAYGSPYSLYHKTMNTDNSISSLGMLTTLRIDIQRNLIGFEENVVVVEEPSLPPKSAPKEADLGSVEMADPSYEANVMNIDFDALKAQTDDVDIISMHEYFSTQEPTMQNEKTGIYEGYNLIMIIAESFSPYAIHPEKTPTLFKMVQEGYNFTNFYNAYWSGSTIAGEYGAAFGLLPINDDGFQSVALMRENNSFFSLGWQLRRKNYATYAFHANTYTYYNRDVFYPSIGYDYYAKGNGLELENPDYWPQSDVETIEASLPFYINSDEPFAAYYMSISGHCNYTFNGNMMSYKHMEEVADLPLSEEGKAYIACNMELDRSLELLLNRLEEAGIADKTLIMITPDHYPYEMSDAAYEELIGHPLDRELEIYKSSLILYTENMQPETVSTPCSAADILPTISNLMGLSYDSRLMSGRDIFADTEHIVFLKGRSWVTDQAFYNGKDGSIIPLNGATPDDAYIERINSIVTNRFSYASKILEHDYYDILFKTEIGAIDNNDLPPSR